MLSVRNLTKIFPGKRSWLGKQADDFVAVNSISFSIEKGEVVGLLGPNGAGKTTTMQMLLNVLNPTSGSINYFGKDLQKYRDEIAKNVAFGSAYTDLPKRLTVRENLIIFGRLYGVFGPELNKRIKEYTAVFGIEEFIDKETGSLSAGQKTRVMLAKTFMVHPKMILLDEPTASLDPDVGIEVQTLIKKQQRELGLTVLLTSHDMDEVAALCSRVIVLRKGEIIDDNTPEKLARSVSSARVHLIVSQGLEKIIGYARASNLVYTTSENMIQITVDEEFIAGFLMELAKLEVKYTSISLEKPTLENYFLEIARSSRRGV